MKVSIIGLERMQGISKKNGNPYAMGKIHTTLLLEFREVDNGETQSLAKGMAGTIYDNVDLDAIRAVEHLPLPFEAELVIVDVIKYGKREGKVVSIRPLALSPASPVSPPVAPLAASAGQVVKAA